MKKIILIMLLVGMCIKAVIAINPGIYSYEQILGVNATTVDLECQPEDMPGWIEEIEGYPHVYRIMGEPIYIRPRKCLYLDAFANGSFNVYFKIAYHNINVLDFIDCEDRLNTSFCKSKAQESLQVQREIQELETRSRLLRFQRAITRFLDFYE